MRKKKLKSEDHKLKKKKKTLRTVFISCPHQWWVHEFEKGRTIRFFVQSTRCHNARMPSNYLGEWFNCCHGKHTSVLWRPCGHPGRPPPLLLLLTAAPPPPLPQEPLLCASVLDDLRTLADSTAMSTLLSLSVIEMNKSLTRWAYSKRDSLVLLDAIVVHRGSIKTLARLLHFFYLFFVFCLQ